MSKRKAIYTGIATVCLSLFVSLPAAGGFDCPADFDGNGDVGFTDLLSVLANWGPCEEFCPEDLNGDGDIGFTDLVEVLSNWGPCP